MSNKGIYLHDIPYALFMKYFFSNSYESDYISDRYSPIYKPVVVTRFYNQTYTFSYYTSTISSNGITKTKNTKTIQIRMFSDLDISKTSKLTVLSVLGIDLDKYDTPSFEYSSTLVDQAPSINLYNIGNSQNGFSPLSGMSLYEYYAVIDGVAHYSITKTDTGYFEFGSGDSSLLSSSLTCGDSFVEDPEKPEIGKTYAEIKRNGKVVGKLYKCPQLKAQVVNDDGYLGFIDKYTGSNVYFEPGKEPKAPIEKYNDYMREIKSVESKDLSPVYGDIYLIQKDGKYGLRYKEKITETTYFISNQKGTVSTKYLMLASPKTFSMPNSLRPGLSMRAISTKEIVADDIVPPASDTVISSLTIEKSIAGTRTWDSNVSYHDSGMQEEFSQSDMINVSELKTFLQKYSAASDSTISSSSIGVCSKAYAVKTDGTTAHYRDGYYSSKTVVSSKIQSAASILGKLTSDSISVKDLISIFSSLGLFYGTSGSAIGSNTLKTEYLNSATKIVESVMNSSSNAYSGSYVGTDYIKSLYLYSKGLEDVCSSMLGYSLMENTGISFYSESTESQQTGFIPKSDLRTASVVHLSIYSIPGQSENSESVSQAEISKAESVTSALSPLRKIHDYDDYELNSKRIYSIATQNFNSAIVSGSERSDAASYIEASSVPEIKDKTNDMSDTKDKLCDMVAQYAYAYDPESSDYLSASKLGFFKDDYSGRFSEKVNYSKNSYQKDQEESEGNIIYSFGSDTAANASVFKSAILNKIGRNN
jgi:hypothetical protein